MNVSMSQVPADRWERAFGRKPEFDSSQPTGRQGCGTPVAVPDVVPQLDPETDTRGGIERVAVRYREQAAKSGIDMTHTDAIARVQAARNRGDRIRAGGNR